MSAVEHEVAETKHLESAPIGPGSLTWRLFGDRMATILFLGRSGTLQNMHPAVSAALQDHSNFFDNPWDRLIRSLPPIMGVIFDPPKADTGGTVRDFHKDIKGTDANGKRYHALNPDIFWWTHVTFVETIIAFNERFAVPLTLAEKDQLIKESVTWWRQYGLSDTPVIDNYADFDAYWNHMLDHELERNATTDYALNVGEAQVPPPPNVPGWLWALVRQPTMAISVWQINALLPPRAREILGLTWTARDERRLRLLAGIVKAVWPRMPDRVRYLPRAYQGMKLARAQV